MKQRLLVAITVMTIIWTVYSAVSSFFTLKPLIQKSLAQSQPADRTDASVAAILRRWIPQNEQTTVLYLNGIDGGDNYYRIRYMLYPVHFIDYWSWQHPNAGGYVWNTPRFSTASSLLHILLQDHVNYVVAVRNPRMLRLLSKNGSWQYIFSVNQQALHKGKPFYDVLRQVVKWQ